MPKQKQPPPAYDVVRSQDGALVIVGVDLDLARSEAARLNAEAKVTNPDHLHPDTHQPMPTGMWHGEVCRYEVRSKEGLIV